MAGKPCVKCSRTAYPLESMQSGDDRWHKTCFKCVKCNVGLSLKTFHKREGQAYCEGCGSARFDKNAQAAETMETVNVKQGPKVGVVNEQVRGELAGQKSNEGTDSKHIGEALKRPKKAAVNEQIRGMEAGQQTNRAAEAFSFSGK